MAAKASSSADPAAARCWDILRVVHTSLHQFGNKCCPSAAKAQPLLLHKQQP